MDVGDIGVTPRSSTEIPTPGSAFSWDHLLHSYHHLLHSYHQLLHSYHQLLHSYHQLLHSYHLLLHSYHQLLHSYHQLLHSYHQLLHSYHQLLHSNRLLQLPSSRQKDSNEVSLPFENSSISKYGDKYNWCTKASKYWIRKVPNFITQNCRSPGHNIAIATAFGTVAPNICGPSVSCHPSGTRNFEMVPNFFNLIFAPRFLSIFRGVPGSNAGQFLLMCAKFHWHRSLSEFPRFPLSLSFHQRSILAFYSPTTYIGPPLWSSGQSFWLQIQRYRVRFPALPDFSE